MSTQLIGFSIGGIARRFLVAPPSMSMSLPRRASTFLVNSLIRPPDPVPEFTENVDACPLDLAITTPRYSVFHASLAEYSRIVRALQHASLAILCRHGHARRSYPGMVLRLYLCGCSYLVSVPFPTLISAARWNMFLKTCIDIVPGYLFQALR